MDSIFIEDFIAVIMCECFCERRKAIEVMKAIMVQFPMYKEGKLNGKRAYLYRFEENTTDA